MWSSIYDAFRMRIIPNMNSVISVQKNKSKFDRLDFQVSMSNYWTEADKREEDEIHRDIISHRLKQDLVWRYLAIVQSYMHLHNHFKWRTHTLQINMLKASFPNTSQMIKLGTFFVCSWSRVVNYRNLSLMR